MTASWRIRQTGSWCCLRCAVGMLWVRYVSTNYLVKAALSRPPYCWPAVGRLWFLHGHRLVTSAVQPRCYPNRPPACAQLPSLAQLTIADGWAASISSSSAGVCGLLGMPNLNKLTLLGEQQGWEAWGCASARCAVVYQSTSIQKGVAADRGVPTVYLPIFERLKAQTRTDGLSRFAYPH